MLGKRTIISCLLPAYMLLVLHAIVPHHHHHGESDRPVQFHLESEDHYLDVTAHHNHHNPSDEACCEKAHHFAHAPEQDEAMIKSGIKRIVLQFSKTTPGYLVQLPKHEKVVNKSTTIFQDHSRSQFRNTYYLFAHTLRGPPGSLRIA